MFLTNVQWSTLRSKLYSLAKLRAEYTIGLVHSMAYFYRTYDWCIGNDFHSLSIFCCGRDLSLTQFHTFATQARTLSLTVPFWTISKSCQGMYSLKILSSVLIYLYRSWCSICKQLHWGISLKNSFQTLLYALQNNSTFISDQQYVIHIYLSEML